MCSILGGTALNEYALRIISLAKDRGRDYFGLSMFGRVWIANHRATPTNETLQAVNNQPFGREYKIVHNGTIANDRELGLQDGKIDSEILVDILDFTDIDSFTSSIQRIRGSYAIAATNGKDIYLACNYKPIFWIRKGEDLFYSSLAHHLGEGAVRVDPYSTMNLITGERREIPRIQHNKALVICSGGLDSVTVLSQAMILHKENVEILHFMYGCRAEAREVERIHALAEHYHIKASFIPLNYKPFAGDSTLFKDSQIQTGIQGVEYALDWVAARNTVMLALATAFAESNNIGYIYLGTNLEESGSYPDNEEQFIRDFNNLLYGAVQNGIKIQIVTPLGGLMKKEIVTLGSQLLTPYHLTWSCYNNGENHCGKCGPCYMRKKAFERANVKDPTIYDTH